MEQKNYDFANSILYRIMKELKVYIHCASCGYGRDGNSPVAVSPKEDEIDLSISNVECPSCQEKSLVGRKNKVPTTVDKIKLRYYQLLTKTKNYEK